MSNQVSALNETNFSWWYKYNAKHFGVPDITHGLGYIHWPETLDVTSYMIDKISSFFLAKKLQILVIEIFHVNSISISDWKLESTYHA